MARASVLSALRSASRIEPGDRYDEAAARIVGSSDLSENTTGILQVLPIQKIVANPDQPRRIFDETALEELAASIDSVGLLQPILVRQATGGTYQIVAGERRWRACKRAGLDKIPALVQSLNDENALEASITENLQREDLSPLEEAQILLRMTVELGYSVRKLATRLGKGKGYVEDRLRLARMPADLQELVAGRPDALTHAREIEPVEDTLLREALIVATREGEALAEIRRRIQRSQALITNPVSEADISTVLNNTDSSNKHEETSLSGRPDTLDLNTSHSSQANEKIIPSLVGSINKTNISSDTTISGMQSNASVDNIPLDNGFASMIHQLQTKVSMIVDFPPKEIAEREAIRRDLLLLRETIDKALRLMEEV